MSALDLPRIVFRGTARIHAPTGDRNVEPIYDLATQRVYRDGARVPDDIRPAEMHRWLRSRAPRFDLHGAPDPEGPLSAVAGWNFGGNGHFSWSAAVSGVQLARGHIVEDDPLVGRAVDLWGHYNPYLRTTANRARFVRHDPTSPWSAQILAGRLTVGRGARSLDIPNELSGIVACPAPARWQRFDFIRDLPRHWLAREHAEAALYQTWLPREGLSIGSNSGVLRALAAALDAPDAEGLVLQFALFNLWAGVAPEGPGFADVVGVIGVHRSDEMRTHPKGRLLVPRPGAAEHLGVATVAIADGFAILDMPITVPRRGRAARPDGPMSTAALGPALDLGPLELRLASGEVLARIPHPIYADALRRGGIVEVPLEPDAEARAGSSALTLAAPRCSPDPLLVERELVVQTDDAHVTLEPGDVARVPIRSFYRGEPAPIAGIRVEQHYNPRAVPGWHHEAPYPASFSYPPSSDVQLVAIGNGLSTDAEGRGVLRLVAARSGTTRVLLSASREARCPIDHDDRRWGSLDVFHVRVLPDDTRLAGIADEDVTYEILYREVLKPYELVYSFMSDEVFSLADRCKVETYARLMWQMSDPANADKTYFMPPTRDLTRPKLRLLRAYLRNVERRGPLPAPAEARRRAPRIADRAALVSALRRAVELEQLTMLSYLFAAYSILNHATARAWVDHGLWTEAQLQLACGDGAEGLSQGFRGALLAIAHEEMIHFLVVNNVLRALGEPFHAPAPDFEAARALGAGVDLDLSPFSTRTLERLLHLERPHGDDPPCASGYASIAALYRAIREAIVAMPELVVVAKGHGGGEHHLFLNEAYERRHPDYQLEVDDVKSACFAIDFVTGQGEGAPVGSKLRAPSHHERLSTIAAAVAQENAALARGGAPPWKMAYPILPNPSRIGGTSRHYVPSPHARAMMSLTDACHGLSLRLMSLHFASSPRASLRRSKLMNASIDVMTGMLRPLCQTLVGMPSGVPGWNAGPGFELAASPPPSADTRGELRAAAAKCERLSAEARRIDLVPRSVREMLDFFTAHLDRLAREI